MEELIVIFPQPSIQIVGIRLDEPMTTITDLLVSAVCFYAFFKLRAKGGSGKAQFFFRAYFLLMGIATFFGGVIGHGFLYLFSFAWKLPGWILSMISVATIERSSIEQAKPLIDTRAGKFFLGLNIAELLAVMSVTIYTLNFKWVELHSGYGLLAIVLPFHLYAWYRTRNRGSGIIVIAVVIACAAALIFMNKISLHTWFNYLDISHTLMAVAAYVFYRGALAMKKH
jgi:hypothetical protein